jgi:intraflagellar transport protein 81
LVTKIKDYASRTRSNKEFKALLKVTNQLRMEQEEEASLLQRRQQQKQMLEQVEQQLLTA